MPQYLPAKSNSLPYRTPLVLLPSGLLDFSQRSNSPHLIADEPSLSTAVLHRNIVLLDTTSTFIETFTIQRIAFKFQHMLHTNQTALPMAVVKPCERGLAAN